MDYFKITRDFWDFAFENPEKIKPNHCALFLFIVEHCNRLGWKEKCRLNSTKHLSKIVLDFNTGVFYESAKEVSDLYNYKQSTFRCKLNGTNPNNTQFGYV